MTKELVLKYLEQNSGYLSGEDLSKKLGISRSAIWKIIESLREKGYVIESVTNRGYKLVLSPDMITQDAVKQLLKTEEIGQNIVFLETVDSTNEEAKRQAQQNAPSGTVFITERQTGGKGRLGRKWVTTPGTGLWFSILLRPSTSPLEISNVTLLAGLAVCIGIKNATKCDAKIKWPNDVVVGSKKVCGILTEISAEMERIHYLVIGIGVNTNQTAFPEEISQKATSLLLENDSQIKRSEILACILNEFELLYQEFLKQGIKELLDLYKQNCVTIGKRISTIRNSQELIGQAVDILPSGKLVVISSTGEQFEVSSGEVSVQGIYGAQ